MIRLISAACGKLDNAAPHAGLHALSRDFEDPHRGLSKLESRRDWLRIKSWTST